MKYRSFLVFFVALLFLASIVYAETDSTDALPQIDPSIITPSPSPEITSSPSPVPMPAFECEVNPALIREFNDLVKQLREKASGSESDSAEAVAIRQKMAKLSLLMTQEKQRCREQPVKEMSPPGAAVGVGVQCQVSAQLQYELNDAWKKYRELAISSDNEDVTVARNKIKEIAVKIESYKRACGQETIPSQIRKTCEIPEDLLKGLETLYAEYRRAQAGVGTNPAILEDLKVRINNLENRIQSARVNCNSLPVDKSTTTAQISNYYADKLSSMSEISNPDEQVSELKELRKEIDETLKNLIEQRKKLHFLELSEMVNEVKITPNSIGAGDMTAKSIGVEIETEVEGSTVSVSTTDDSVVITQDGLNVETSEVSVSDGGLSVGDSQVVPPKRLLEVKVLERNRERIQQLNLERGESSMVYNAQVQAKKRILGIIPATAQQSVTMNAETGEVISQEKPWWTAISTDVK